MKEDKTCDNFAPELKAYQDGQLGWWARRRVRRHTAKCAHCREEMQAMREFSQFLQGGTGETLPPQLRARILAAVPDTVPAASPVERRRPVTRPMLAWGAVASALILCLFLTPLFLKNDRQYMDTATTSAPASAKSSASDSASSDGNFADNAANSSASRVEMKMPASTPRPSLSAPSTQEHSAVSVPGNLVDSPAPTAAMPDDKSITAEKSLNYAAKIAPEAQKATSVAKSADFDSSVAIAQGNNEHENAPRTLRTAPPANSQMQAGGKADASSFRNTEETVSHSTPAGSAIASAGSGTAMPTKPENRTPSLPVGKPVNGPFPQKTNRPITRNSARSENAANNILLVVANVAQSRAALEQKVKSNGGAITATKEVTYDDNTQAAMLTLNVPSARVPALLSELDTLGEHEPFVTTPEHRSPSLLPAHGRTANNINSAANKQANVRADSSIALQTMPAMRSQQRARNMPNSVTSPSVPAAPESKASNGYETPQPNARVTIHLQQIDKR